MSKSEVMDIFRAGRRVSTPLMAVETADQWAFIERLRSEVTEKNGPAFGPKLVWDLVRGVRALDDASKAVLSKLGKPEDLAMETSDPVEMLKRAEKLPGGAGQNGGTILCMMNVHAFFNIPAVVQAISNLRDLYKKDRRTLLLLGPGFNLPAELQSDVVLLSEELPGDDQIKEILMKLYKAIDLKEPPAKLVEKAIDAARGLSAFAVEQVFAMSLRKDGLDLDDCWQRKEAAINQTRGLKISRGQFSFDDLGGLAQAKKFFTRFFGGRKPPRCIVFIDEIEKALAGIKGDMSGVAQDALGVQLQWMQNKRNGGAIFLGPAGSGKTAFAQSMAAAFEIPLIIFDLGAMKGSLVGESEFNIRNGLRVVDGVAGENGGAFVIATCNSIDIIPNELQRRFTSGKWFFDLPTAEEREAIWTINLKKFDLDAKMKRPDDADWTGAEIYNCCSLSWQLNIPLEEASEFVVPVAVSSPEQVERLRALADNRILSASYPGKYKKTSVDVMTVPQRAVMVTAQEIDLPQTAGTKKGGN